MKHIKLFIFIGVCISIYLIYILNDNNNKIYLSLGDSFALGENSYGQIDYSYGDYIRDNMKKNNELHYYTKKFASKDMMISDMYKDIEINKKAVVDGHEINIRHALREASIVTVSIGLNDLLYEIARTANSNLNAYKEERIIESIVEEFDLMVKEMQKYYPKTIYIVGYCAYYEDKKITQLISKLNEKYRLYAQKNEKVEFVDTSIVLENISEYYDNPNSIYPNYKGYKVISEKLVNVIFY